MVLLRVFGLSFFSVGALGVAVVFLYFQFKYRHWRGQAIRCPTPIFPLGNAWAAFFRKHLAIAFKDIYDQFPQERVNGMWVIHRPYLMVRDLDIVRDICIRDFVHFRDRGFYFSRKRDPLAGNIFVLKGSKWRNIRTKMTPAFTSGRLKAMFHTMVERGNKLGDILQPSAAASSVVEVKDLVARYATDVVTACVLGVHSGSLENPKAVFRVLGKQVFEASWTVHLKSALCFLVPDLAHLLQIINTPKDMRQFFLPFIRDLIAYRETNDLRQNDFMHMVVSLKKQGYIHVADYNGNEDDTKTHPFTFLDAAAQAFIFWAGGFETSATTIQFALYELALNQDIQRRLRRELQNSVEEHGQLTYEGVNEMEYLSRIVDETLRKYPPVAIINRECTKTYRIPELDIVVDKGVSVLIPVLGIHLDPKHYPDPHKFDPNRFSEEQKRQRHHYAFLPFGEGPHSCIGQRFALMQIKVCLAVLLSRYQFDVHETTPPRAIFDKKLLVYTTKDGIPLKVLPIHSQI